MSLENHIEKQYSVSKVPECYSNDDFNYTKPINSFYEHITFNTVKQSELLHSHEVKCDL